MRPSAADLEIWSQALLAIDGLAPYVAPITGRLIPVPVKGLGDSISCDANFRVYFDPAYSKKVGINVFTADVLHEVLHLVNDHPGRAIELGVASEDHDRWNIAADEAINGTVFAIAASRGTVSPGGQRFESPTDTRAIRSCGWVHPMLLGHRDGLLAEDYNELLRQQPPPQQQQQKQQQGGAGKGKCGSAAHGNDEAMAETVAAAEAQHGPLPKGPGETEQASLRLETAEAILAHVATHGTGSVPAGLVRTAEQLRRPPKVDWRRRLAALVRGSLSASRGAADYSFTRPRWRDGIAGPRLMAPVGRVAIVADTSGSMSEDDLARVLDETSGVLRSGSVEAVWWIATDSKAARPVKIRDLGRARLEGGGGTAMGAGLDAAAAVRPRPHVTIVITDGDTPWPTIPPACGRVLIVRTRTTSAPSPHWAAAVVDAY